MKKLMKLAVMMLIIIAVLLISNAVLAMSVDIDANASEFDNGIKAYANSKEAGTASGGENNNGSALKWEDGSKVKMEIEFEDISDVSRILLFKNNWT